MQLTSLKPFTPHVPPVNPQYVKANIHDDVHRILASKKFFPTYIYGPSGVGKTECIRQACAQLKLEFLRVQIGPETDRSSLINKFALLGGETVFIEGPVLAAMRNGSVLMLDELDRGTDDLMCLQGILEGNPVLIEETGEVIHPAPGFTIIATGNTGGRGDVTGKFSAANELDHAFLERFKVVYKMLSPKETTEYDILKGYMEHWKGGELNEDERAIVSSLTTWAAKIRNTEEKGEIDFSVSTRRLTFIIEQYVITGDIQSSLKDCLGVYDSDVSGSLKQMFKLINPEAEERKRKAREAKEKADREIREKLEAEAKAAKAKADQIAADVLNRSKSKSGLPDVKGNMETVVLSGKFKIGDRNGTVKPHLTSCGFNVKDRVTSRTDYLVIGEAPGQAKMDKAKKYNITIITEDKFFKKFASKKSAPVAAPATTKTTPASTWAKDAKEYMDDDDFWADLGDDDWL